MTVRGISRRAFLGLAGACGLSAVSGVWSLSAQTPPNTPDALERLVTGVITEEPMALDLRAVDQDGAERFRIMHNAYAYYPVASAFKMMVVLYYFMYTPRADWQDDPGSKAYRVAVYSNNPLTGELLDDTAQYVPAPGNPIERFNYFLRNTMELQSGLHDWDYERSPTQGTADSQFAPSSFRSVRLNGQSYPMENVFFAADLSKAWYSLLQTEPFPLEPQAEEAIERTLALFSIPAEEYESPLERVLGSYTGKDGVIPEDDSPVGRVLTDAGIVQVKGSTYVVAAMYMGNEYRFVELLRDVFGHVTEYEAARADS